MVNPSFGIHMWYRPIFISNEGDLRPDSPILKRKNCLLAKPVEWLDSDRYLNVTWQSFRIIHFTIPPSNLIYTIDNLFMTV
jgi:hypothetical protein